MSPLFLCWSVLGLLLTPVLLCLCLVSGLCAWYLHKLDTSGARIVPEKPQGECQEQTFIFDIEIINQPTGDHCPVHGEKKASTVSRSDERKAQNATNTRSHKHSKSRNEH